MNPLKIAFLIVVAAIAGFIGARFAQPELTTISAKETAYDRVMRTGTLRCGYFSQRPSLIKDPNTGEFSGIIYDYVESLGERLSLKIDWVEEVGLGDYPAALASGRIDAMCTGIWVIADRARGADFVTPVYYLPLYAFARTNDAGFDENLDKLNDENVTIAVLEGGATVPIRQEQFPLAKEFVVPQLSSVSDLFVSLDLKKADALIYDLYTYYDFSEHNPGKIRQLSSVPVKTFSNAIAVPIGDYRLQRMLSLATQEMHQSGAIERFIKQNVAYPDVVLPAAKPYALPEQR